MRPTAPLVLLAALAAPAAAAADVDFAYTYPPQAARIAPLRAWIEADKARLRAAVTRDAAEGRREAVKGGYEFRPYGSQKEWKVVTETPRFLSLSAQHYTYSGGAHGGTSTSSIVWDKAAGRRLAPMTLFADPQALWAAVRAPFCAALKAEQRRRLEGQEPDGDMHACPPLKNLVLLVGSHDGRRIDRLGLVADQYVAGSYAEGIYDITVPVTPAVLRAVKPAYRAAFAAR